MCYENDFFFFSNLLLYLSIAEGKSGADKSKQRVAGSLGGEVPEKYYVVRNNEMVRVKYLLVYTCPSKPPR